MCAYIHTFTDITTSAHVYVHIHSNAPLLTLHPSSALLRRPFGRGDQREGLWTASTKPLTQSIHTHSNTPTHIHTRTVLCPKYAEDAERSGRAWRALSASCAFSTTVTWCFFSVRAWCAHTHTHSQMKHTATRSAHTHTHVHTLPTYRDCSSQALLAGGLSPLLLQVSLALQLLIVGEVVARALIGGSGHLMRGSYTTHILLYICVDNKQPTNTQPHTQETDNKKSDSFLTWNQSTSRRDQIRLIYQ